MNSREVSREIRTQIKPWLKEQGFQKITARNAWRTSEDTIEILNFQSFNSYNASVMGVTTFSFSINLGVFYRFSNLLPWSNSEPLAEPKYYDCHANRSALKGMVQQETDSEAVWFIDERGENLVTTVADAKKQIVALAPNWFEEFTNIERAIDIFRNRPESYSKTAGLYEQLGGRGYSLSRATIISFLAIKTGNIEKAIDFWTKLKETEFYRKHSSVIEEVESKIAQLTKII